MVHDVKTWDYEFIEEGHYQLSYSGTVVLVPAIDMQRGKEVLEKVDNGTLVEPKTWLKEHRGTRIGCGRLSDAMMVADAVRGISIKGILNTKYPYKKSKSGSSSPYCYRTYTRAKVFNALSVNKPEDYGRICDLIMDYPEVFKGLELEKVFNWIRNRTIKG